MWKIKDLCLLLTAIPVCIYPTFASPQGVFTCCQLTCSESILNTADTNVSSIICWGPTSEWSSSNYTLYAQCTLCIWSGILSNLKCSRANCSSAQPNWRHVWQEATSWHVLAQLIVSWGSWQGWLASELATCNLSRRVHKKILVKLL